MQAKKHPTVLIIITCFVVVFCFTLAVLIISLINQVEPPAGHLIYSPELNSTALDIIHQLEGNDLNLKNDVELTTYVTLEQQSTNDILYNIQVPITDFYDARQNVDADNIEQISKLSDIQLVSVIKLNSELRLLSLNNQYYLDNFNTGGFYHYLHLEGEQEEDLAKITTLIQDSLPAFPNRENVLSLAQTGVTALSRGMYTKLRSTGDATFFTKNLVDILSQFDYRHTSNEASFSNAANANNICAAPAMLDAITSLDFNIIELTGNHNLDCGDQAALDTLSTYERLGIQTVGGGANVNSAAKPLTIQAKESTLTILAYNYSTGGYTLDETPGANFFTLEKATNDIKAAKERRDFVIVDIQFFECNSYDNTSENTTCDYADSSEGDQIAFFRRLIDLGADIVVGTAAHQPQTYEQYHNGTIYYGLGNLFFDQSWWPGTTRSLILVHYFWNNQLLQTRIIPTVYDQNYQTKIMDIATAKEFIERLNRARPKE